MDVRLAEYDAGVVDEIAGGDVVGAVDDDVVRCDEVERVGRCQFRFVSGELNERIEVGDAVTGGREL